MTQRSYVSVVGYGPASVPGGAVAPADDSLQPELADIARLGRRLLNLTGGAARGGHDPLRDVLRGHLGPGAEGLPPVRGSWGPYDHADLPIDLEAWLARVGPQRAGLRLA